MRQAQVLKDALRITNVMQYHRCNSVSTAAILEKLSTIRYKVTGRSQYIMEHDMEWRASHILVKEQGLAKRILQDVKRGARFDALAREYSTCPSKSKGGDLGWFGEGKMVKAFEDACRKASVGSIKGPVRTQFGYHVIKLTGRK